MIDLDTIRNLIKQHEIEFHGVHATKELITAEQFLAELKRRIGDSTQTSFAKSHNIAISCISDILTGRREVPQSIAAALGYKLVKMYVKM